jgi:hypothetical protein
MIEFIEYLAAVASRPAAPSAGDDDRRGSAPWLFRVSRRSPDLGEVREELEAEYNADPIAIGFNPKYVVELLTQMTSDQITISLGGELDPGLIRPVRVPEI